MKSEYGSERDMVDKKPLVSIVTVVFNGVATIERTIKSIIGQTYENIEYIVIDGGSADGTVDLLKKYDDEIDFWVSERDSGIYNAMNKGLAAASGDIISILNADDYYLDDAVEKVVRIINAGADIVYGRLLMVDADGSNPLVLSPLPAEQLLSKGLQQMPIPHVTFFARKDVYVNTGRFDETFRIAADHDYVVRALKGGYVARDSGEVLAVGLRGGVSSNLRAYLEDYRCAIKNSRTRVHAIIVLATQLTKHAIHGVIYAVLPRKVALYISRCLGSRHVGTVDNTHTMP